MGGCGLGDRCAGHHWIGPRACTLVTAYCLVLRCRLLVLDHSLLLRGLPVRADFIVDKVPSALLARRQVARDARHVSELEITLGHHRMRLEHLIRVLLILLTALLLHLLRAHHHRLRLLKACLLLICPRRLLLQRLIQIPKLTETLGIRPISQRACFFLN